MSTVSEAAHSGALHSTIMSFSNIHQNAPLFQNFFRARRESFIVQRNWDLPEEEGMEFDQYDTPQSRWIAVHDGESDAVLGGFRLTPTTARCGIYSYMIRDASLGLLDGGIPQDLLSGDAPVTPDMWECTRVFVAGDVEQRLRRTLHLTIMESMMEAARTVGAERLIALTDANWPRWYGRRGLTASAAGPILDIDDGKFQVVVIEVPTCPGATGQNDAI